MERDGSYSKVSVKDAVTCSVCIANYNGEKYLQACIDSVLQQEFSGGEIEIMVHDDCSQDQSVRLIEATYQDVKLIKSTKNVGFCISNNRLVAEARGEYVLLLNNDAILHEGAIQALYDASQSHGEGIFGLPQYDAQTGELIDIGSTFDPFLNPVPNLDKSKQDVGMVTGACFWLSRKLWVKLGGFPDWFGSLAEDTYLCCNARLQGFCVKAIPLSGYDHWVGRSLGGGRVIDEKKLETSLRRRSLSERNKTFVMATCYPFWG